MMNSNISPKIVTDNKVKTCQNKNYQKNDQLLPIMFFKMIMDIFQKKFFFAKNATTFRCIQSHII